MVKKNRRTPGTPGAPRAHRAHRVHLDFLVDKGQCY